MDIAHGFHYPDLKYVGNYSAGVEGSFHPNTNHDHPGHPDHSCFRGTGGLWKCFELAISPHLNLRFRCAILREPKHKEYGNDYTNKIQTRQLLVGRAKGSSAGG